MAESNPFEAPRAASGLRRAPIFQSVASAPAHAAAGASEGDSLSELKKIVLSIDWEITPEALDSFLDQVFLLREAYREDKAVIFLLHMLEALGKYIRASRTQAHPATFGVLNSVFSRLEEMVRTPCRSAAARHQGLRAELEAFRRLRAKIRQRRSAPPPAAAPVADSPVTAAMLASVTAELKEYIRRELDTLRQMVALSAAGR